MNLLGIKLAPLFIPLHRRIETFLVFQWCMSFLIGGFLGLILSIYLLFTSFFWVSAFYFVWLFYDWNIQRRGGRRSKFLMNCSMWRHMANYFPAELHKTADLDPKNNYLVGFHPHGVMSIGAFLSFATEATGFSNKFPCIKRTLLILKGQFLFPFWRDYLMSGAICDVSSNSVDYILGQCGNQGNAAIIVVGGAIESLEAHPNSHTLYLWKRKGFIKKAIIHGSHLVPVYSFGETDIYDQIPNPDGSFLKKLQAKLTKIMGFAPPIFHGRGIFNYTFGVVPYRKPINTVVGKPIPVLKDSSPTQEKIDELHKIYMEALNNLFDEHKVKYGVDKYKTLTFI